jgi:hypothetical protein
MKKHNYLNNKDILKEIHKSKLTYCSFIGNDVTSYDIIIPFNGLNAEESINSAIVEQLNITAERKELLRQHELDSFDKPAEEIIDDGILTVATNNRQIRLAKEAQEAEIVLGNKRKLDEFLIPAEEIPVTDLVFRVMCWDHIPIDEAKQQKSDDKAQADFNLTMTFTEDQIDDNLFETEYDEPVDKIKGPSKYVKVNFPPFYHFKVTENLIPYIVGKSHWKGDLEIGEFNKDHGQMTNKLALMFMKLCERYATRSNWRGYTYNDEMRCQALLQLSQIGLQFDEFKSQNPFAYYTAAITNSFTRVLNIEKRNQRIRDDILEMNNFNPSYTRQNERNSQSWNPDE